MSASPLGRYAADAAASELVAVHLLGVPVRLMAAGREHHDSLMREFRLLAMSGGVHAGTAAAALVELTQTLGVRYAGARARPDELIDGALDRGEDTVDLHYEVPPSVAEAARLLEGLLREADRFCEQEQLITMARTPLMREFADWYLDQFSGQCAGGPPARWGGPVDPRQEALTPATGFSVVDTVSTLPIMASGSAAEDDATLDAPSPLPAQQPHDRPGRFLSAVLNNLSDALVACDVDGVLTLFNPAAQRLHGLPAATVPTEQWPQHYDLYDADGVTRLAPHDVPLLRALRGEVVRDVQMVVKPAGQSARTLLASGQQILDEHGDVQGAVVVMHDITARRAAEALRASQSLLEQQRLAAEASLTRLEQLNSAALAVARQHSVDGVLEAITEEAAAVIGAEQAVSSLTRGNDWSQAVTAVAMGDGYSSWSDDGAMPDGSGIYALVCETNRPLRLTQAQLEAHPRYRGFGAHAPQHPPMRGWLAAPLIRRDGSNLGLIHLSAKHGVDADGRPAEFDDQDEALLVQLAQLASLALEKAVAYEREHQVAVALQRSLLPQTLPTPGGLTAHVEYVPGRGEADLSVGGDFYDLFEVDDNCVALALGDVVGHGLRSASLMGQIRSGLRGLAMQQADPAQVVPALDKLVATLGDEAMATLAYATLHLPTGRLRLVLAGHPPPMLRSGTTVRQILAEPGLPLGAVPGSGYAAIDVHLDPDVTLLFYSDGLVEHRHRSVSEGIAQLERSFADGPLDLAALCAHLLNDLTGGANDDDVALLAITRTS